MSKIKQKEAELRINHVVEIAEELFRLQGFENVTMDQIAKSAELSKTTIYKSFKSKDELALMVYQKINVTKMAFLKQAVALHIRSIDKLKAFGKAYFAFFKEYPDYLKFQLYWDYRGLNKENISQEMIEYNDTSLAVDVDFMKNIFMQGIDEGSLRNDLDVEKTLDILYLTLRAVMNQILFINNEKYLGSAIPPEENDYVLFFDLFIKSLQV